MWSCPPAAARPRRPPPRAACSGSRTRLRRRSPCSSRPRDTGRRRCCANGQRRDGRALRVGDGRRARQRRRAPPRVGRARRRRGRRRRRATRRSCSSSTTPTPLQRRAGLDALAAIANELPPLARLAVASRRELPLPVARLRAQRLVTEIGPRDLAMTRTEAARLLADAGHQLDARRARHAAAAHRGLAGGAGAGRAVPRRRRQPPEPRALRRRRPPGRGLRARRGAAATCPTASGRSSSARRSWTR